MNKPKAKPGPGVKRGSRLNLHRGNLIVEDPVEVTVDQFRNGRIWIKGSSSALHEGDTLVLEYLIEDDGRYLVQGEVEERSPDCTVISLEGEWRRVQDRSFVRISTHGIEVKLPDISGASLAEELGEEPGAEPGEEGEGHFEMLDVSAGGIQFETDDDFEIGQEFVCQFELSDSSRYEFHSRVVRSEKKPGYASRYRVAVEFLDLTEEHCAQLLRWIYQEQSRRRKPADSAT